MAITKGINYLLGNNQHNSPFASDWWILASLDDSDNIANPQETGKFVTAKAISVKATGSLAVVSPGGNAKTIVVTTAMLDTIIHGPFNAIKSTGTVTIAATDVTVYA